MTVCSIDTFLENDLSRLEMMIDRRRSARELMRTLTDTEDRHDAIVLIQSAMRGCKARRERKWREAVTAVQKVLLVARKQELAVTTIQKAIRTRLARVKAARTIQAAYRAKVAERPVATGFFAYFW